jgi:hypothetical protein
MRLIDGEGSELQTQLKIIREAEYQIYGSGSWGFTAKCEHAIEDAPTIQPEPQIIYCKDCENWDTTWTNDFSPNYHYCPMVDGVRKEDWFCADAERRTE